MNPDIQIAEQTDLDLAGKPEHMGICLLLFLFIGVIEGQKLYVHCPALAVAREIHDIAQDIFPRNPLRGKKIDILEHMAGKSLMRQGSVHCQIIGFGIDIDHIIDVADLARSAKGKTRCKIVGWRRIRSKCCGDLFYRNGGRSRKWWKKSRHLLLQGG